MSPICSAKKKAGLACKAKPGNLNGTNLSIGPYISSVKGPTSDGPFSSAVLGEPRTPLEFALTYADLGLRVLPCYTVGEYGECRCREGVACRNPGKHSAIDKWPTKATISKWWIHRWWFRPDANVGIATGRGLAVIDVDLRHGGIEALAALEAELGFLPRDWVVETGGGGLHIYLRVPKRITRLRDLAPGVEVKYARRFVIAPPSVHFSGKRYVWQSMVGELPPRMPKQWLEKAKIDEESDVDIDHDRGQAQTPTGSSNKRGYIHPVYLSGPKSANAPFDVLSDSGDWPKDAGRRLTAAALRCLVTQSGTCNLRLLELARSFRSIPGMAGRPYHEFLSLLAFWHAKSSGTSEDWPAIRKHWARAWKYVNGPRWDDSRDKALVAYRAVLVDPLPGRYADATLDPLAALCAELDRRSGAVPWYLSARKAADLLGVSRWKAHACLTQLVTDGVIERATEHKPGSPKAQRYRYSHVAPNREHDGVIERVEMPGAKHRNAYCYCLADREGEL